MCDASEKKEQCHRRILQEYKALDRNAQIRQYKPIAAEILLRSRYTYRLRRLIPSPLHQTMRLGPFLTIVVAVSVNDNHYAPQQGIMQPRQPQPWLRRTCDRDCGGRGGGAMAPAR